MQSRDLRTKKTPSQKRGGQTFEVILRTAAKLLEAEGFEQLSTNKICAAAGLTPPALYRYFPNKYAIVSELATRLMAVQNTDLYRRGAQFPEAEPGLDQITEALAEQVRLTKDFPGGVAILKTLYATPQLAEIRLSSHRQATEAMLQALPGLVARLGEDEARRRIRLLVEIGNSLIEMITENPDLDAKRLIDDTAEIFLFHLRKERTRA